MRNQVKLFNRGSAARSCPHGLGSVLTDPKYPYLVRHDGIDHPLVVDNLLSVRLARHLIATKRFPENDS